jgi:hypothetical protein
MVTRNSHRSQYDECHLSWQFDCLDHIPIPSVPSTFCIFIGVFASPGYLLCRFVTINVVYSGVARGFSSTYLLRMSYSSTPFFLLNQSDVSIHSHHVCISHVYTHRDLSTTRRAYIPLLLHEETANSRYVPVHTCHFSPLHASPIIAKFFAMPPGKKAPPQQSSLLELWANKPKQQGNPATSTTATSGGHPRLPDSHGTADAVGPTISSEERAYRYSTVRTR